MQTKIRLKQNNFKYFLFQLKSNHHDVITEIAKTNSFDYNI